jgi:hypothetical protein
VALVALLCGGKYFTLSRFTGSCMRFSLRSLFALVVIVSLILVLWLERHNLAQTSDPQIIVRGGQVYPIPGED